MNKSVFDFVDYKAYLLDWLAHAPKRGRGLLSKWAEATRIHKTTFSQIIRGPRHLSLEQAELLARSLELSEGESEYLVLLVNLERAGSTSLRAMFKKQIQAKQRNHQQLSSRVVRSRELTSEEKAIFYSSWLYSAVRNITALQGLKQPSQIANRLRISHAALEPVLEFLLGCGLCVRDSAGLAPGPQLTHIEAGSPLVARHHGNWRVKAMERHPMITDEELSYTAPVTLSNDDVKKIRALLADLVQNANKIVQPSLSERLFCLNLDWFEVH